MKKRLAAINKILESYRPYYNIEKTENAGLLVARCDYHAETESHFISKKAKLWSAVQEQYLYILSVDRLDAHTFDKMNNYVLSDGMDRLNIGPGHMSSEIAAIFICSECEKDIYRKVKRSGKRKNFKFTINGWMDFFPVVISLEDRRAVSAPAGKDVVKSISKILMF